MTSPKGLATLINGEVGEIAPATTTTRREVRSLPSEGIVSLLLVRGGFIGATVNRDFSEPAQPGAKLRFDMADPAHRASALRLHEKGRTELV